ncbi:hypothetical protein AWZ03_014796 [Drosophila navojoa]|uniref:Uncharacterized protein n=1 Tax=Drosophila navojoa TaxID=7232 RepID=A0A484ARS9_DRONA|nr:hypothetical protein AWZ03_014796 [Drosophila navojoa]
MGITDSGRGKVAERGGVVINANYSTDSETLHTINAGNDDDDDDDDDDDNDNENANDDDDDSEKGNANCFQMEWKE